MASYSFTQYGVLFYGGSSGYNNFRAQLELYNAGVTVGRVRFVVSGAAYPADNETAGVVTMHLPESAYDGTIDLLRNEKPLAITFNAGRGFLGTSNMENAGEDDA